MFGISSDFISRITGTRNQNTRSRSQSASPEKIKKSNDAAKNNNDTEVPNASMTVTELKSFAKDRDLEIPKSCKTKATIIDFLLQEMGTNLKEEVTKEASGSSAAAPKKGRGGKKNNAVVADAEDEDSTAAPPVPEVLAPSRRRSRNEIVPTETSTVPEKEKRSRKRTNSQISIEEEDVELIKPVKKAAATSGRGARRQPALEESEEELPPSRTFPASKSKKTDDDAKSSSISKTARARSSRGVVAAPEPPVEPEAKRSRTTRSKPAPDAALSEKSKEKTKVAAKATKSRKPTSVAEEEEEEEEEGEVEEVKEVVSKSRVRRQEMPSPTQAQKTPTALPSRKEKIRQAKVASSSASIRGPPVSAPVVQKPAAEKRTHAAVAPVSSLPSHYDSILAPTDAAELQEMFFGRSDSPGMGMEVVDEIVVPETNVSTSAGKSKESAVSLLDDQENAPPKSSASLSVPSKAIVQSTPSAPLLSTAFLTTQTQNQATSDELSLDAYHHLAMMHAQLAAELERRKPKSTPIAVPATEPAFAPFSRGSSIKPADSRLFGVVPTTFTHSSPAVRSSLSAFGGLGSPLGQKDTAPAVSAATAAPWGMGTDAVAGSGGVVGASLLQQKKRGFDDVLQYDRDRDVGGVAKFRYGEDRDREKGMVAPVPTEQEPPSTAVDSSFTVRPRWSLGATLTRPASSAGLFRETAARLSDVTSRDSDASVSLAELQRRRLLRRSEGGGSKLLTNRILETLSDLSTPMEQQRARPTVATWGGASAATKELLDVEVPRKEPAAGASTWVAPSPQHLVATNAVPSTKPTFMPTASSVSSGAKSSIPQITTAPSVSSAVQKPAFSAPNIPPLKQGADKPQISKPTAAVTSSGEFFFTAPSTVPGLSNGAVAADPTRKFFFTNPDQPTKSAKSLVYSSGKATSSSSSSSDSSSASVGSKSSAASKTTAPLATTENSGATGVAAGSAWALALSSSNVNCPYCRVSNTKTAKQCVSCENTIRCPNARCGLPVVLTKGEADVAACKTCGERFAAVAIDGAGGGGGERPAWAAAPAPAATKGAIGAGGFTFGAPAGVSAASAKPSAPAAIGPSGFTFGAPTPVPPAAAISGAGIASSTAASKGGFSFTAPAPLAISTPSVPSVTASAAPDTGSFPFGKTDKSSTSSSAAAPSAVAPAQSGFTFSVGPPAGPTSIAVPSKVETAAASTASNSGTTNNTVPSSFIASKPSFGFTAGTTGGAFGTNTVSAAATGASASAAPVFGPPPGIGAPAAAAVDSATNKTVTSTGAFQFGSAPSVLSTSLGAPALVSKTAAPFSTLSNTTAPNTASATTPAVAPIVAPAAIPGATSTPFSFGASSTAASTTPGPFSFGVSASDSKAVVSTPIVGAAVPTTPAPFVFGATAAAPAPTPTAAFQFGATSNTPSVTAVPAAATATDKPALSLGLPVASLSAPFTAGSSLPATTFTLGATLPQAAGASSNLPPLAPTSKISNNIGSNASAGSDSPGSGMDIGGYGSDTGSLSGQPLAGAPMNLPAFGGSIVNPFQPGAIGAGGIGMTGNPFGTVGSAQPFGQPAALFPPTQASLGLPGTLGQSGSLGSLQSQSSLVGLAALGNAAASSSTSTFVFNAGAGGNSAAAAGAGFSMGTSTAPRTKKSATRRK